MKLSSLLASLLILAFAVEAQGPGTFNFKLDTNHSNIGFAVPIWDGLSSVRGKFTNFTAEIVYDEKDIKRSSVKAVIKTDSVNTGIPDRDAHLRTKDFFDVEKYPEITFTSKRIEKRGKQLVAIGDFTMHGVTKEIELPFMITGVKTDTEKNTKVIGAIAKLTINRQDYGVAYRHGSIPTFVGDHVDIDLHIITRSAEPAS